MAGFDCLLETEQGFLSAARAGTADGLVSEELEGARDQFAVEALADDDGCAGATEIKRAGQDALVPEAKDFGSCSSAEGERRCAKFGDGLETPGATDDREQSPNEARDHGQDDPLAQRELWPCGDLFGAFSGHSVDFTAAARNLRFAARSAA